jgi:hypothetical protein
MLELVIGFGAGATVCYLIERFWTWIITEEKAIVAEVKADTQKVEGFIKYGEEAVEVEVAKVHGSLMNAGEDIEAEIKKAEADFAAAAKVIKLP